MIVFGKDFKFGVSMSGFQFEMGKSEESIDNKSDWFRWVHDELNINSGIVSGDLPEWGPGYWDLYKKDHILMKDMGLEILRIGIEWSRIFPEPTLSVPVNIKRNPHGDVVEIDINLDTIKKLKKVANKDAISHYRNIMEDIKEKGFVLMVDLNHFTLPIWLHDPIGVQRSKEGPYGWVDEKTVVEFAKYSALMAYEFSDIVDYWSTMNEPQIVSHLGYLQPKAGFPPGVINFDWYLIAQKHQAEAHVRAYEAMKKFTDRPIGFIYSFGWPTPLRKEDEEVLENAMYFFNWHFTDMILWGMVDEKLKKNAIERIDMKGKADFIGINYYARTMIKKDEKKKGLFNWHSVNGYGYACAGMKTSLSGRPVTDMGWEIYPEGIKGVSVAIMKRYGKIPIFITENGVGEHTGKYIPYFIVSHLVKLHEAMEEGADVRGYMYWSFMDNYEWALGFSKRFGLLGVDRNTKMRIPKPGYFIYREIIKNHGLPDWMLSYTRDPYVLV